MILFEKLFCGVFRFTIPHHRRDQFVSMIMKSLDLNPLRFAYGQMGILKYANSEVSGESFVIKKILPSLLSQSTSTTLTMFDVGANVGQYSLQLNRAFPEACIFSFEPNPHAFKQLKSMCDNISKIRPFEMGFDAVKNKTKINVYSDDLASSHGTLYEKVLTDIHERDNTVSFDVSLERVDEFARKKGITHINFLKIDTEGNEYRVLKSAEDLIHKDSIDVIQFEFNEMNIISRVFLKDFYDLLGDRYKLFRLNSNNLIPLRKYNSSMEIFKFQNILAVHNKIANHLETIW